MDGARGEALGRHLRELGAVVRDARARSPEDEARPHHDGKPICSPTAMASSRVEANPEAGTSSPISPIAALNRSRSSAVLIASALAPMSSTPRARAHPARELHGEVERRLPTERRQEGVGTFALDDRGQHVGVERLDVGPVCEVGVGHDRGGIGVGEHDRVALGPQHPARLGARVVELARLADHDGTRADHEDPLDVGPRRGIRSLPCHMRARKLSNR